MHRTPPITRHPTLIHLACWQVRRGANAEAKGKQGARVAAAKVAAESQGNLAGRNSIGGDHATPYACRNA